MNISVSTPEKIQNVWHQKEKTGDLSIEEVNEIETFRSLKDTWNTLLWQCPDNNIFLTWEWLFTWWQHYGKDKKLRIFLIKESDRIIAIAPFMQWKYRKGIFSIDLIENLGGSDCGGYGGIILTQRKDDCIALLIDYLEKTIRDSNIIARMWHIPENSSFLVALREKYPSFSSSVFLNEQVLTCCPYIMLPATWEDFLSTLSQVTRRNLRRAVKVLQKEHTVEFKKYACDDDLRGALQVLFELHQKRWTRKSKITSVFFTRPESREFYVDVSKAFYQNNWLYLSFLNVDGKAVSAYWGFTYNGTFWAKTCAFDRSYSDYSVGTVHLVEMLERAIRDGMTKFDFLQGNEEYKLHWASGATNNIQITMTKRGVCGKYRANLLRALTEYDYLKTLDPHDILNLVAGKIRRITAASKPSVKGDRGGD